MERTFVPGDVIVKAGTYGDEMYLVLNGTVGVLGADERTTIARLEPGAYFGELAVLFAGRLAPRSLCSFREMHFNHIAAHTRLLHGSANACSRSRVSAFLARFIFNS